MNVPVIPVSLKGVQKTREHVKQNQVALKGAELLCDPLSLPLLHCRGLGLKADRLPVEKPGGGCRFWAAVTVPAMAQFHFTGLHANTGYFGISAPPYGLNPPPYSEASPPYPKLQSDGMDISFGYQSNYPSCPQGPPPPMPHMPSPPYPITSQFPCAPPQYGDCQKVLATPPMACTTQNVAAAPPILPSPVNQRSLASSCVVTQQSPLAPYMASQQLSSTLMIQSGSGVTVSNMYGCYPTITRQPSKSLTKEISSAVLTKIVQHATTRNPKYKNQVTIITGGNGVIIHK
ncbi:zinc finger homeobox protein 3-like [Pristis pectinata]|uniref:zinc finger homeobox protein 3-like n=1 Tax=Pristis pectinata TaxID=685728 RepID=UPI00223E51BF|nr:zinc finger homeobox protein 3-like [Pristis pectinata]